MYCSNCNCLLPDGSKFCNNCGTKIIVPEKTEKIYDLNPSWNRSDSNHNKLILISADPINDGFRKYNFIYCIFFTVGLFWGFTLKGDRYGFFIVCGLGGIILAWIIKTMIISFKAYKLRQIQFSLPIHADSDYLYCIVSPELSKYGMSVKKSSYGLCITHNGIIYDLYLNDNYTFSLLWRLTIVKAILSRGTYINIYRKAVASMGLIAYTIQRRICQNSNIDYPKHANTGQNPKIKKSSARTKAYIIVIAMIIIFSRLMYNHYEIKEVNNTSREEVDLYNQIYGTNYDAYDYIRRDSWWNKLIGKYDADKEEQEKIDYYINLYSEGMNGKQP